MQTSSEESIDQQPPFRQLEGVVLRLLVRNHPGVMSHISGLFARRAFNVEAILCLPLVGDERSVVFLLVKDDDRLDQLERQLAKLEDVLAIEPVAAGMQVLQAVPEAISDLRVDGTPLSRRN